ncbi:probable imidazolonepropionase [Anneissia japonica]|uniref:probable imidazolonepropionase n=1 Tax=Anneissia japonica TaxID=1529436 RepID=UPI0014254AF6|nr:probable imidazolonepropionase [Anneissia japonica]
MMSGRGEPKVEMRTEKLLIRNARQIVAVCSNGERVLCGEAMKNPVILNQDGGNNGVSLVIGSDGLIKGIGSTAALSKGIRFSKIIDATGKCVVPGLIDGHTHPVWAGDRVHEFSLKLAGASYMEVHKAGGGINFTVEHTRQATENELYATFKQRLEGMLRCGTTLVECKSGYGLDAETEIKMLKVIQKAKRELAIDVSSTYCGAHAVPMGHTSGAATIDVIQNQLPKIVKLIKDGQLEVDNIDVFCEQGVFNKEQTRRILTAGRQAGLALNFHGDELHPMEAAELGGELKAEAVSHLEEISDAGIKAMAESGSIAVILPTTAYILRLKHPPVRKMIEEGVAVALGSDFNPNAFCMSMPLVMHLACVNLRMSMQEALVAATINAAASLRKSSTHGSIEVGKVGDVLILDAPRWEHLIYQMGNHEKLIEYVIKQGDVVHQRDSNKR